MLTGPPAVHNRLTVRDQTIARCCRLAKDQPPAGRRGRRLTNSARAQARSRRAQADWSLESSSMTHRRTSSARIGKSALASTG